MCDYREELELAVDWAREAMPDEVREAIGEATASLYYGPSAGRWQGPLEIVRGWAESIDDVRLTDFDIGEDGEEIEYECGCIDSRDIVREIIGPELTSYL